MNKFFTPVIALTAVAFISITVSCSSVDDALNDKAFCDGNEYSKATQFCNANTIYEKCSDKEYNPVSYVCSNGTVVPKEENNNSSSSDGSNPNQSSSGGTKVGECKDFQGRILFCQYEDGCFMMDDRYGGEPEDSSWTCAQHISNCETYGSLYTGVSGLTEDNGWGKNLTCSNQGGAPAGDSPIMGNGGSLWGPDADKFGGLQVQTPAVLACKAQHGEAYWGDNVPCRDAGWWFGFVYTNTDDANASVEAKINDSYTKFSDVDVPLANADGVSRIDSDALRVKFTADAGDNGAGISFDLKASKASEDISAKNGFCITYTSTASIILDMDPDAPHDYNTWLVELPASATKRVENLPWSKFRSSWLPQTHDLKTATSKAINVKIRLASDASVDKTADFALMQLGWLNECN
ncbi:MAG: hypothetical protein FWH22_04460 [Fibromonadales bacterium]|nr:hypothetical protein [Fibromonadales bacterium]